MIEESLLSERKQSNFGLGWFYNIDNGRFIEIPSSGLGPHGDHDGWLTLDENAKQIGIDVKKAKDFREATYGFIIDPGDKLYDDIKNETDPDFLNAVVKIDGGYYFGAYSGPSEIVNEIVDEYFMTTYGHHQPMLGYSDQTFPELIRVRYWPNDRTITISRQFGGMDGDMTSGLIDLQDKLEPWLNKVKMINITTEQNYEMINNLTVNEFLSIRNHTDVMRLLKKHQPME